MQNVGRTRVKLENHESLDEWYTYYFKNSCFGFHQVSKREKTFYCFRAFGNLMKPEARVFKIASPTKKIGLNYHLNKFSQFKYVKMWFYHLIAALTIFECPSLSRCPLLFVNSERTRCFAKQMAKCEIRPPKTREEEVVCGQRYSKTCASSLLQSN